MTDIIITKVHDKDCDICLQMSKHDRATFESIAGVNYREAPLDYIVNSANTAHPITYQHLYHYIESRCLTPTYEIDLPVYIAQNKQSRFLGHIQGAKTIVELRDWVKSISETSE